MAIGMIAATRTVGAAILDVTNSILCHLEEMRLNHLLVLLEKGDQSVGELEVGSGEEADDLAALRYREAARSGQALDIALDGVGQVVVDHILDARHVQSPLGHVGDHNDVVVAVAEGTDDGIPFGDSASAMEAGAGHKDLDEGHQLVDAPLALGIDHHLAGRVAQIIDGR